MNVATNMFFSCVELRLIEIPFHRWQYAHLKGVVVAVGSFDENGCSDSL